MILEEESKLSMKKVYPTQGQALTPNSFHTAKFMQFQTHFSSIRVCCDEGQLIPSVICLRTRHLVVRDYAYLSAVLRERAAALADIC